LPFTLQVSIENNVLPTFSIPTSFCENAIVPVLPTISNNGISGSWFPSVISNQNNDSYLFTPDLGQCALPFTLQVSISSNILPTFSISNSFCENANVPILPTISDNGISGSWFPSVISNQNSDEYLFTPDANQCALPFSLDVSISNNVLPTFSIATSFCENANVPILPTISNNGISGSWFPSAISNQNSDAYLFTPDLGQCALPFTLNVLIVPFSTTTSDLLICLDDNANAIFPLVLNTGLNRNLYSFTWFENNLPLSVSNESLSVSNVGVYEVLATRNSNGCSERFVFNVEALQPIEFTFEVSDDFAPTQFVTIFASGGSGNYLYSFNNLPFQENPTFEATNAGEVLVVVKDENGCYETTKRIAIWNYPKFFTPNGDGLNDSWGIKTRENIQIYIYDRYGKLIKNLNNSEQWNGTFNDQNLPASDYWFVLYYDNKIYKSNFSLVR
jgi:gliding motility-associated-like protein